MWQHFQIYCTVARVRKKTYEVNVINDQGTTAAKLIEKYLEENKVNLGLRTISWGYGVTLLTGNGRTAYYNTLALFGFSNRCKNSLANLKSTKKIALASAGTAEIPKNLENVIKNNHIYTVLYYDKKLDFVVLRNPWGSQYTPPPGVGLNIGEFRLTWAQFDRHFS